MEPPDLRSGSTEGGRPSRLALASALNRRTRRADARATAEGLTGAAVCISAN